MMMLYYLGRNVNLVAARTNMSCTRTLYVIYTFIIHLFINTIIKCR